jgi:RNA-splicing ligase RtcB
MIRELPEEAPFAYKDVDDVVSTCEQAGLCATAPGSRDCVP